jgi:hypothetical protein
MSSLGSIDSAQDRALSSAKQGKTRQKPQPRHNRDAGQEAPEKTPSSLLGFARPPVKRLSEPEHPGHALIVVSGYATLDGRTHVRVVRELSPTCCAL